MSNDNFKQEEDLERQSMLKGLFPLMKSWYNSEEVLCLRNKYGDFPLFLQDFGSWKHIKLIQKIFLSATEKKESGNRSFDLIATEESFILSLSGKSYVDTSDTNTNNNDDTGETVTVKRKRNRWGAPQQDVEVPALSIPSSAPTSSRWSAPVIQEDTPLSLSSPALSRWGAPRGEDDVAVSEVKLDGDDVGGDQIRKPKASRWSTNTDIPTSVSTPMSMPMMSMMSTMAMPTPVVITQEMMQQTLILKMQMQNVNERMVTVIQDALRIEQDPSRSPSPPPRYDSMGKRTNTREIRMRESLIQDRGRIIEELLKLNPTFQPPADFIKTKPVRRIPIPKDLPNHNFIGLIIGPRGNTQKEMEQKTNCKISIRGKGSVKEGSKGRANKIVDEDEDLHVHITGDNADNVEIAVKMVLDILNPKGEEEINAHKQKQLRELVR